MIPAVRREFVMTDLPVTIDLPAVGGLSGDQVAQALTAATLAPSLHNSQPWRFEVSPAGIGVRADPSRRLPAADPDDRELHLACGAAVANLVLAIRAAGFGAQAELRPDPARPELLAHVTVGVTRPVTPREAELAAAIPLRHTCRRAMQDTEIPAEVLDRMHQQARLHSCWLAPLTVAQTYELQRLLRLAHRAQQADPAFVAEFRSWTGRPPASSDGVPAASSGTVPDESERLLLRDFSGGTVPPSGRHGESDPAIVVVGSFHDLPLAWLQAGGAMQRVLLTATAGGLATSFLSQAVEVPEYRRQLRTLIGGALWPQAVLRLGHAAPVPAPGRRPLEELVEVR